MLIVTSLHVAAVSRSVRGLSVVAVRLPGSFLDTSSGAFLSEPTFAFATCLHLFGELPRGELSTSRLFGRTLYLFVTAAFDIRG